MGGAVGLVMEWASLHQGDLLAAWHSAEMHMPLGQIEPLR